MEKKFAIDNKRRFLFFALIIAAICGSFIPERIDFNYKLVLMILMVFLSYYMVIEFKLAGSIYVCIMYGIGFVVIGMTSGLSEYHTNAVMAFQLSVVISVVYLYSYVSKNDFARKQLYTTSIMDDVTHIYNKRYFGIKSVEYFEHAVTTKERLAIMIIDIDAFKSVNDRFGHAFGDKLLKAVASEINRCIRAEDTIFRYGGDEFVMLIRNYTDESLGTINERINRSIDTVNRKFVKELNNDLTVSVGVAVYPDDSNDLQDLFSLADKAMYKAKEYEETKILKYDRAS